ncbi:MAG: hypothetical protein LBB07_01485, partial [Bifidobacteriaceae bacterium]|nr:hypothetical protein [Bifidobacteriaceae bacterium]
MKKSYFIPSPHSVERFNGAKLKVPKLIISQNIAKFPLVASAAPLLMGAVMFAINPNPMSVAFMALSPVIVVANFFDTRWTNKKNKKKEREKWQLKCDDLKQKIVDLKAKELGSMLNLYPQISIILDSVIQKSSLLWSRTLGTDEFLSLRIGSGNIASSLEIENPNEDLEESDNEKIDILINQSRTLSFAPVFENLQSCSLGVINKNSFSLILQFLIQLAALHRPKDLKISYLATPDNKSKISFAENLPHFIPYESINPADLSNSHCVIFCLSDFKKAIELSEQNENIHLICLADTKNHLPSICTTYIDFESMQVFYIKENKSIQISVYDNFDFEKYKQSILVLSSLDDPANKNITGRLPKSVLFSDLKKHIKQGEPNYKLEAAVGVKADVVQTLSLVENGPHVFIGDRK